MKVARQTHRPLAGGAGDDPRPLLGVGVRWLQWEGKIECTQLRNTFANEVGPVHARVALN